jgi:alkyl hydroperoxide reductase subunit AhpC
LQFSIVGDAVMPDKEFGTVSLSDYTNAGKWLVFFWYPLDFTFVCPTEICAYGDRVTEFQAIGCEVLGASCDSKHTHLAWVNTLRSNGGLGDMQIPLLADFDKTIANKYGVLINRGGDAGIPCRAVFIIDPTGTVRHITMNDPPVGRNVDETLRLVKGYQYTDEHGEVCPANWTPGDATMVADPKASKSYFANVADTDGSTAGAPGTVAEVNDANAFQASINASGLTVVDYWAPWCKNCKSILPSVQKFAIENPSVAFIKVNIEGSEELKELGDQNGVGTLPSFQFFKGGMKVGEWSGSKADGLQKALSQYI